MKVCDTLTAMIRLRPDMTEIAISEAAARQLAVEIAALDAVPSPETPYRWFQKMKAGTAKFMDRSITIAAR